MPRVRKSTDAADNPVLAGNTIEASDFTVGQDNPRLMKSTGPAKDSLEPAVIEPVDRPVDDEKMQMLAFFAQPVKVRIAQSTDKSAEQIFEITVNGKTELFRRGEVKTVPRFIVERLARLKETHYTQQEVINADGIKDILQVPHTALKYDFAVLEDPHPRGREWLEHTLAEA